MTEAKIEINGQQLSEGEAITIRVALATFSQCLYENGLGDDENGIGMVSAYQKNIVNILKKMFKVQS